MNVLLERLLARIEITEASECWIFPGASCSGGYGQLHSRAGGRNTTVMAHRVSYEGMVGPIPEGMHVHHRCHVRPCVNPDHLEVVGPSAHGAEHSAERPGPGFHVLTEDQVRAIKADSGSCRALAVSYGVSPAAISNIRTGRTWSHVR